MKNLIYVLAFSILLTVSCGKEQNTDSAKNIQKDAREIASVTNIPLCDGCKIGETKELNFYGCTVLAECVQGACVNPLNPIPMGSYFLLTKVLKCESK